MLMMRVRAHRGGSVRGSSQPSGLVSVLFRV